MKKNPASRPPATPTHALPIAQPSANMRWVSMPMSAAACRSCAVACSARPVSECRRKSQRPRNARSASALAVSCGRPRNTPPTARRPASSGSLIVRKSTPHRNCAPLRRNTARPKVAKIWASIGPPSTRRIRPQYVAHPSAASASAVSGSASTGSRWASDHAKNATYMASMRNSPWAKLTISMRPKMSDRPAAIRAYTHPMSTPPTAAWRTTSSVRSLGPLLAVLPLRDRVEHVPRRRVERVDGVILPALHLKDDPLDAGVLARRVELDAIPRHDELVAGDVGRDQRPADRLRLGGARAGDRVEQRHHPGEGARRG